MQSSSEQEVSLHQLLQLSTATPDYIQVKPEGFMTILQSTVEFFEAHNIQANLLVKLPRGDGWNEDVQRYGRGLEQPHQVFRFVPSPGSPAEQIIVLATDHLWRNDYFVVVQSESFAAMVVAHRLRPLSATAQGDGQRQAEAQPSSSADDEEAAVLTEAEGHRVAYLSVCCSANPDLVATVLSAIVNQIDQGGMTSAHFDLTALAQQWSLAGVPQTLT
ncbi:MAG: DICT sensory domain-containing protein, partial [Nodosilinea sp.]